MPTRWAFLPIAVRDRLLAGLIGVPKGIRTPVTAVKGQCPRPLDDGDADDPKRMVELGGIEPPTSCMPCKRSPS